MAGYKKTKVHELPPNEQIKYGANPDSIMNMTPSWRLASCDVSAGGRWSFTKERLQHVFWDKIFPKLRNFESMTWRDIFLSAKKQNHSETIENFNKDARDRLLEMQLELESIQSLHIGGKLRIYGFMTGAIFNILWYDDDHGDNKTCVRRSSLKHT